MNVRFSRQRPIGRVSPATYSKQQPRASGSYGASGGKLEVGRPADFFTVDLNDISIAGADVESLLSHVVFALQRAAIRGVFVDGRQVIGEGHHPHEEQITQEFVRLQRRLSGYS